LARKRRLLIGKPAVTERFDEPPDRSGFPTFEIPAGVVNEAFGK
jgi:hypothetical protein